MIKSVIPVSVLVHQLKNVLDTQDFLHNVMIEGEISNLRKPYSGHWYFSLKDSKASLACVMFSSRNRTVSFVPKDGDKVILTGDVTVYEAEGRTQLLATSMKPSGIGDLYLQLEALKKKMFEQGYFNEGHKQEIPPYAMHIGLITGADTAARADVLKTLRSRWPIAEIKEYHAPMQGKDAAPKIMDALNTADKDHNDILILARGGGSLEDLWCFNDEKLAIAIYHLNTPIITGIGHEIDFTLAEFTSDYRANTPTGAAEAAVPDMLEVQTYLSQMKSHMQSLMQGRVQIERQKFVRLQESSIFTRPERIYSERVLQLNHLEEKLMNYATVTKTKRNQLQTCTQKLTAEIYTYSNLIRNSLHESQVSMNVLINQSLVTNRQRLHQDSMQLKQNIKTDAVKYQNDLKRTSSLLDAYSPLKVLARGYSVSMKEDTVITSIKQIEKGDSIHIKVTDGTIYTEVKEKKNDR